MSLTYAIIWLVLAVLFALVEFLTPSALVSMWFSFGAIVSALTSFATSEFWVTFLVFVGVSLLSFVFFRPIVKKAMKSEKIPTNADMLIGMTAVVTDLVDDEHGMVKVKNEIWSARSENKEIIEVGTDVTVIRIEGVKLIVKKKQK